MRGRNDVCLTSSLERVGLDDADVGALVIVSDKDKRGFPSVETAIRKFNRKLTLHYS